MKRIVIHYSARLGGHGLRESAIISVVLPRACRIRDFSTRLARRQANDPSAAKTP